MDIKTKTGIAGYRFIINHNDEGQPISCSSIIFDKGKTKPPSLNPIGEQAAFQSIDEFVEKLKVHHKLASKTKMAM